MTTPPPLATSGCPMLHGAAFAARPSAVYDQLRAQGPAGWAEIAPGVHALVVTDHRAAVTLLNDTAVYSKDSRLWAALAQGQVPPDSPVLGMMAWRPSVLYTDGDEHARLRWAMDDCIARISPHRLREITRRSALTLIARVIARGQADLMADFADMVPMLVFADLLGCPPEKTDQMVRACQDLISAGPEAAQGAADFAGLLFELIQLRRARPGQDLTSWMINHGAALSDDEALNQLFCVTGAGLIPAAAATAWTLHLLLRDDEYAGSLAAGTLTVRRALSKALWERAPMANFSVHFARYDTYLHGVPVPGGVPILISHAAANTDPALPSGLSYDSQAHLAWSAGPHRCPAISQATTIVQTAVETILDQLWDMTLTDESAQPLLRHGPFHQCPQTMPVTFRPKSADRIPATAIAGGTS
ncbi:MULTISPECIES: cytochrome P450 [Streptomyces]|uniref:Putative cytochrome P450 n=1 Tax=Streptomyces sp. F2 TaxID=317660 RepID=V9Z662_9ACTN|nr:cytochrome P450 [Streptomyces sp. F2]AHE39494.1 Putative cytochrome P450 [Streptomyces sp. F2]WUC76593.1 cytochrome P450 [Streptomyces longwoodensis]